VDDLCRDYFRNRPETAAASLVRGAERRIKDMEKMPAVFFAALFALLVLACCGGDNQSTGNCSVDCSNWTTGRTDMRNYTNTTRDDCIQKGKTASCPTKWCSYSCESSCCETVY